LRPGEHLHHGAGAAVAEDLVCPSFAPEVDQRGKDRNGIESGWGESVVNLALVPFLKPEYQTLGLEFLQPKRENSRGQAWIGPHDVAEPRLWPQSDVAENYECPLPPEHTQAGLNGTPNSLRKSDNEFLFVGVRKGQWITILPFTFN